MPVPKRKVSKSRRDMRSANKGLKDRFFAQCSNCQDPSVPHSACKNCGFYKGTKVIAGKLDRQVRKAAQVQKMQEAQKQQEAAEPKE